MDWLAIDFETANEERSSPCAVGVVVVRKGHTVGRWYRLIKPKGNRFDPFNIWIHGITPEDVMNEPEFPEIWPELYQLLATGIVIAHNASFDMSVLRHTLQLYHVPFPDLTYSCTRVISKATWPGWITYRLTTVAERLGIEFQHHNALEDARACSEIARLACEEKERQGLDELAECLRIHHGRIHASGKYTPAGVCSTGGASTSAIDVRLFTPSSSEFDVEHPFYQKMFAFTGTLSGLTRREAMQKVVDVGGRVGNGVTKDTNFLVLGEQDFRKLAEGQTKSTKMLKAERLLADGSDIEIISEKDFLDLLEH